jgi:hypothetical protein
MGLGVRINLAESLFHLWRCGLGNAMGFDNLNSVASSGTGLESSGNLRFVDRKPVNPVSEIEMDVAAAFMPRTTMKRVTLRPNKT